MRKVVPTPSSLLTCISPPIRSVSILLMVRPSPVPPAELPAADEPRAKGSNTLSSSTWAMPGPVSLISTSAISRA